MLTTHNAPRPPSQQSQPYGINQQDVKAALHVEGPVTWEDCTDRVDYNQGDQLLYMEPLYNFLLCVCA